MRSQLRAHFLLLFFTVCIVGYALLQVLCLRIAKELHIAEIAS